MYYMTRSLCNSHLFGIVWYILATKVTYIFILSLKTWEVSYINAAAFSVLNIAWQRVAESPECGTGNGNPGGQGLLVAARHWQGVCQAVTHTHRNSLQLFVVFPGRWSVCVGVEQSSGVNLHIRQGPGSRLTTPTNSFSPSCAHF